MILHLINSNGIKKTEFDLYPDSCKYDDGYPIDLKIGSIIFTYLDSKFNIIVDIVNGNNEIMSMFLDSESFLEIKKNMKDMIESIIDEEVIYSNTQDDLKMIINIKQFIDYVSENQIKNNIFKYDLTHLETETAYIGKLTHNERLNLYIKILQKNED